MVEVWTAESKCLFDLVANKIEIFVSRAHMIGCTLENAHLQIISFFIEKWHSMWLWRLTFKVCSKLTAVEVWARELAKEPISLHSATQMS